MNLQKSRNTKSSSIIWNTIGNPVDAGMVTIAFAIAQIYAEKFDTHHFQKNTKTIV